MPHISLKSIQNKGEKNENIKNNKISVEKDIIKVDPLQKKDNLEEIIQKIPQTPISNELIKQIDVKKDVSKLSEQDRYKQEALIKLYIGEFHDKLSKYKSKNLSKMTDDDLMEFKKNIQKEIMSSNSLSMISESSKKLLDYYEEIMCGCGINIKGTSNILKNSPEYNDTIKAMLLKYLGDNLIMSVEPEYKLLYLLFSTTLICHANNEMIQNSNQINNIEKQPENTINYDKNQNIKKLDEINEKYNFLN